ncbi:MAG TPA: carbohydrate kinase [Verrucomicrobia bacterium]|nr:carbohydrate kinase [Verrucomicrobiota bacterium]
MGSDFSHLKIAVAGDFCLDRYFEIDPYAEEISLETGLPVHNLKRVRCQPGAAGTVVNNLAALQIDEIIPIGFCGKDGEGWELKNALASIQGINMDRFIESEDRCTFTYSKPLLMWSDRQPEELSRLDRKNTTPTPPSLTETLSHSLNLLSSHVDAVILMDQVDLTDTGVVNDYFLSMLKSLTQEKPDLPVIADSRRGLQNYPPLVFKMNHHELSRMTGKKVSRRLEDIQKECLHVASHNQRPVIVTMAEMGMATADVEGQFFHQSSIPVRGEIDIVGAGDSVTANLAAALGAGRPVDQAIQLATLASSIVIHKLGTTGTASIREMIDLAERQ